MTEIGDVGRFQAAVCALEAGEWEHEMEIVGATLGVDMVTEFLGAAVGADFKVMRAGRKQLEERAETVEGVGKNREEVVKKLISQIELVMLEETEGVAILRSVTNRLCPAVKPVGVADHLQEVYSQEARSLDQLMSAIDTYQTRNSRFTVFGLWSTKLTLWRIPSR